MKQRVVVTGLGMITPLGLDVDSSWRAACAGQSGIRLLEDLDPAQFRTRMAGTVLGFDASRYLPAKEMRRFDAFVQYGVAAAVQAMAQAGLSDEGETAARGWDRARMGVCMGSGIGGLRLIESSAATLVDQGARRVSPFFVPGSIINMISGLVAIRYGLQGPNLALATACTTSTHSIGLAARLIAHGDADLMLAGGAECASTRLGLAGFAAMQAMSTRNEVPAQASRPFDVDRDGFVLGDGAGAVVLESLESAQRRGATVLAELVGFGMSDDAYHITAAPASGQGAALAMQRALQDAGLQPEQIDYINAHGTSTPVGDPAESQAIESVFGAHAPRLAVSSTKSMTGHLLGAAGAVEAIFSIKALHDQMAPPTINLNQPDPACRLDYVPHQARAMPICHVLSNSFGFGGTNGSLIFARFEGLNP